MFEHAVRETALYSCQSGCFPDAGTAEVSFFPVRITVDNVMRLGREGIFYNLTQKLYPLEKRVKEASLAY